jgi:hypothetical protein
MHFVGQGIMRRARIPLISDLGAQADVSQQPFLRGLSCRTAWLSIGRYLKPASHIELSMQQIARLLQPNVFLKCILLALLKNDPLPAKCPPSQWALPL